jgi:hypothetical protein
LKITLVLGRIGYASQANVNVLMRNQVFLVIVLFLNGVCEVHISIFFLQRISYVMVSWLNAKILCLIRINYYYLKLFKKKKEIGFVERLTFHFIFQSESNCENRARMSGSE